MIKEKYKDILNEKDIRNNLIDLKGLLKKASYKEAFKYMLAGDYTKLISLFENEDPKVRKNVAAILGELEDDSLCMPLYDAYEREATLFVKTSYLKAIGKLDYVAVLPQLRDRREELLHMECSSEDMKHIRDEIVELNKLIEGNKFHKGHKFTGYALEYDIVLTTNPSFVKNLKEQIGKDAKALKSGVRLKTDNIRNIANIRTYNEMLFCLNELETIDANPLVAADMIAHGNLLHILKESHNESGAFRYRVEVRGVKDKDERNTFAVSFSKELDRLLAGEIVNDTSNYEVEVRLVKNKDNKFIPFLKMMTLADTRFDYRVNILPVSMQPYNVAIMLELAKEYLSEDARVLDPFCGVGTLLIERRKIEGAATLYGVDIYGKAIEGARENTEKAGIIINYINRDYKDFSHEYRFDEIITEMPYVSEKHNRQDIKKIYEMFFDRSGLLLNDKAIMIICSDEPDIVKEQLTKHKEFILVKNWILSEKSNKKIFVISYSK